MYCIWRVKNYYNNTKIKYPNYDNNKGSKIISFGIEGLSKSKHNNKAL